MIVEAARIAGGKVGVVEAIDPGAVAFFTATTTSNVLRVARTGLS
jgi:hypothetical protein